MARYAAEGVRSVLVTCTDGSLGFAPDGTGPTDPGHDRDVVAKARAVELEASARAPRRRPPRAARLPRLGDGGLAAERRAGRVHPPGPRRGRRPDRRGDRRGAAPGRRHLRRERLLRPPRPRLHPPSDDGRRGRVERRRRRSTSPRCPSRCSRGSSTSPSARGWCCPSGSRRPTGGRPTSSSRTEVDCTAWVRVKHAALAAHATQVDNADLVGMPDEVFDLVFGTERYVRALDTHLRRRCPSTTCSRGSR